MRSQRSRAPKRGSWVGLLLAVLAGCGGGSLPDGAVARIGDRNLHYDDFVLYVEESLGGDASRLGSEVLSRLFERFLDDQLLLQLARDRGFAAAEATVHQAATGLIEAYPSAISVQDVERYYNEHSDDFERPARVRLRQILVQDRAAAELALAELEAGVDFGEVARLRSIGPSAPAGGLQGELSQEDLPGALVEIVFALGEGEWSELLEAEYGFRIFEAESLLPQEVLPLSKVASSIRARLEAAESEELIRAAIGEARQEYNLRVAVARLPFEYSGAYAEPAAAE